MESLEDEEFDLNWVCCLLDDIPSTCCDSSAMQPDIPLPIARFDSFPSSTFLSEATQDSIESLYGFDVCCRKRVRVGSVTASSSSKACREKQRRDHLNERFLELSEILESGTKPKFDKAAILTDAIRQVKLLREETSNLTSQNGELKEKINELKVKKKALRGEKHRLVSEKEKLEQRIKSVASHPSLHFHPTSVPSSYAIPCQAVGGKLMPLINYSGVPFWQFAPQAAFDTSQDHVFHPPVA
ncbi:transcription factor ILR3-like [Chenopodium quinoa]|uniref:transcription factor ILR3-like n=1 Tax=Chenopodium quinoa TaxID=63459 RepID=UPI000B79299F|nr:transcription factor ILR3-like [Chenopodium quinoa]